VHCAGIFRYIYNGASADELAAGTDPLAITRQAWAQLCGRHGVSLAAAAIAFAVLPPVVDKVVMGFALPGEVEPTLAAAREAVPPALWHDAQAEGLLVPELQLPPA
jgi:D-threo-aldose 1-dehydrogenase